MTTDWGRRWHSYIAKWIASVWLANNPPHRHCASLTTAPKMVLPDVEARTDRGRRFDALLLNHWFIPRLGTEARCPRCWVRAVVAVVIDLWALVEGPVSGACWPKIVRPVRSRA